MIEDTEGFYVREDRTMIRIGLKGARELNSTVCNAALELHGIPPKVQLSGAIMLAYLTKHCQLSKQCCLVTAVPRQLHY